ncbi:uncharacterized protein LOC17883834 [Capsella rubella]|uniref:uncharacterized protein LOC17883834 n=1 Tax=Capsella rubella TaxID=81985 RepID=UPI000CD547B4|nr:uncharacterized protein LOC17883834 [Capsella rubella]
MASSSGEKKGKYPPLLYPPGKSPLLKRSIHHNCTLASFGFMKDCIGEDVYKDIRDHTQVGVLLSLADSDYVWWAKLVHYILTRQLAIERRYEIWSLIEGCPIMFSLYEYEDISRLNCQPIVEDDIVEVDHREFWAELKVDSGLGPNWYDLDEALKNCRTWTPDKRKMLGLFLVVHVGILGLPRGSTIPLEYAKRVLYIAAFDRFPCGGVGFMELLQSIKVLSFKKESCAIHGCVHVLMIWAFDCLKHLGKTYGNKKKFDEDFAAADDVPPLLMWSGKRPRIDIAEFFATEKLVKKKIVAEHVSWREEDDIFPFWPDEVAVYGESCGSNKLLDNLLHDIFLERVDERQWDVPCTEVGGQKKMEKNKQIIDSDDVGGHKKMEKRKQIIDSDDVGVQKKMEKRKQLMDFEDEVDPPPQKKQSFRRSKGPVKLVKPSDESGEESSGSERAEKGSLEGLMKLLGSLTGKVDSMHANLGGQMEKIGNQVNVIEKKVTVLETNVCELKKDKGEVGDKKGKGVKIGTEVKIGGGANDEESKTGDDGGSGANAESWRLETKQTSQDEFPISCVVRNPTTRLRLSVKKVREVQSGGKEMNQAVGVGAKELKEPRSAPEKKRSETAKQLKEP